VELARYSRLQSGASGPEKYDERARAMIAELKYGAGMPFHRRQQLERRLGVPLPAATQ
jgi:hypothetical protein